MEQQEEAIANEPSSPPDDDFQKNAKSEEGKADAAPEKTTSDTDGDSGVTENDKSTDPEERLKALEKALEQEKERSEARRNDYLRAMADMDNLRKRTGREKENARKFALEGFSRDLLTLADNVDRTLTTIRANLDEEAEIPPLLKSLVQGAEMIEGELKSTFSKHIDSGI